VIIVNAEKIHVTGQKMTQKKYYRHSGYPGGLRVVTLRDQLQKFPARVLEHAVQGMLPKNKLGRRMFRKLKVYAGPDHPHQAQQPKLWEN
jgi:large subunit ribosomal protein L13